MGQEYRDTIWARLERIAEKLSGLYWYSDYHGFDSVGQDCGCRQRTHGVRYRKIMALLRQVEEDLNSAGFRTLAAKKAVQTELKEREYDLLSDAAKKHGLTIKEAARRALFEWSRSGIVLKEDPLFDHKPAKFKRKIKSYQTDRMLARSKMGI